MQKSLYLSVCYICTTKRLTNTEERQTIYHIFKLTDYILNKCELNPLNKAPDFCIGTYEYDATTLSPGY